MNNKQVKSILSGLSWSFGERILAQGITFCISVILARMLSPDEYGIIALVLVFINLSNVFVVSGFGEALIQKKQITEEDFSTMFWCSISFSFLLYFILYRISPFIAKLYNTSEVIWILRVLAIKIPIASMNTIQRAYLARRMEFKKFFFATVGGTVISGIIGIVLAYKNYGVWALVWQYITNSIIDTLVLYLTISWKPKLVFKIDSARTMIGYSWKITGASFINELYSEIRSLIIGKVYSPADLAFYNRGNQFPSLFITNINSSICTVFFPVMSRLQDDKKKLKQLAKKTLKISTFIIFPLLMGLIGISKTLIIVLLTKKWLPSVFYLNVLCFYWMVQPMQSINWQILKAIGKSDLCLKLEIIKKTIGFSLVFLTMFVSVRALTYSTALFAIISMLINMIPNGKLINYYFYDQLKDIAVNMTLASSMGLLVFCIGNIFQFCPIANLILQIIIGMAYYIGMSYIFRIDSLIILKNQVLSKK